MLLFFLRRRVDFTAGVVFLGSSSSAAAREKALERLHWMISGRGQTGKAMFPQNRIKMRMQETTRTQKWGKIVKANFTETRKVIK